MKRANKTFHPKNRTKSEFHTASLKTNFFSRMKRNRFKLHTFFLSLICLVCASGIDAQTPADRIAVTAELRDLRVTGDSLFIDTDIFVSPFEQSPSYELILTPVIYNKENRVELQSVLLSGPRRAKLDRRLVALKNEPRVPDPYAHFIIEKGNDGYSINYKVAIPYEDWMPGASMIMLANNCGCGNEEAILNQTLLVNIPTPGYDFKPSLAFIAPPKEEIKRRDESSAAYVTFETGRDKLLPNFANNPAELDKIRKSVEYIKGEPTTIINSVSIIAYASPEGSENSNLDLSRRRAAALREYVRNVYDFQSNIMHSDGRGEDWNTLKELVEKDGMISYKDQILQAIASVYALDKREEQIKAIDGGRPYRYLLENHYPMLRRSDYKISYTVPGFSIEKGKEVLKTRPGMLSLEELYQIASTYEEGSDEFKELFDIAVRLFPEDRIANLNAASATLLRKDAEYAAKFLKGYENDRDAYNSFGVYHTLMGDYEKAEEYLKKASANGSLHAKENLRQLEELKRVKRFQ